MMCCCFVILEYRVCDVALQAIGALADRRNRNPVRSDGCCAQPLQC